MGEFPNKSITIVGIFNSVYEFDQNLVFLSLADTLFIDKSKDDQNLEIYIEDPMKANTYKEKIKRLIKIILFILGRI